MSILARDAFACAHYRIYRQVGSGIDFVVNFWRSVGVRPDFVDGLELTSVLHYWRLGLNRISQSQA